MTKGNAAKSGIDKKLESVYAFIKSFSAKHGYPPSVREICAGLKISSTASAYYYLKKLEKDGRLTKSTGKNRAIDIRGSETDDAKPELSENLIEVPLLGKIAAGIPITAVENLDEVYPLPKSLFRAAGGDGLFMLTIKGNSMIEAGIFDGDKIIIKPQPTANNGEIVAALIDDEATVKRLFKRDGHIILHPENKLMQDIVADNCEIIGVAAGLIRKL